MDTNTLTKTRTRTIKQEHDGKHVNKHSKNVIKHLGDKQTRVNVKTQKHEQRHDQH